MANALIHRDYHRLGAVHIRLEDDALEVSNPGGLVDGVTLQNLLVTEPRPRNRALAEAGFVEAHGATRGRTYMLSAAVYGAVADKAAYTRQAGFAPIQNEQMVLSYVRQHGRIKRAVAMELCRLSEGQVKALLKRMCQSDLLVLEGAGPVSYYRIGASDRMKSDGIGWNRMESDQAPGLRVVYGWFTDAPSDSHSKTALIPT